MTSTFSIRTTTSALQRIVFHTGSRKVRFYFVTFRLADAVPHNLRTEWESERDAWLRVHPKPWSAEVEREYHNRFSGAIESWLDAGHGSCVLRRPRCAAVIEEALHHFDGDRVLQSLG